MASFKIREPTEADISAMHGVAEVSYPTTNLPLPDGTVPRYFPDTPEGNASHLEWRVGVLRKRISLGRERHVMFVVVEVGDGGEEKVVGWTGWDAPQAEGADASDVKMSYPPHAIKATFDWCKNSKKEGLKRVFPNDEHKALWELAELCIHPDYHGKGLGRRLYQHGFDAVGAQDKDFFFFARTPAVPFYLKQGATLPDGSRVHLRSVHDIMVWRHE